jgi:hypothetical protein
LTEFYSNHIDGTIKEHSMQIQREHFMNVKKNQ